MALRVSHHDAGKRRHALAVAGRAVIDVALGIAERLVPSMRPLTIGPEKLSGHWTFEEEKEGFGCTQISEGKGYWTAEAQ